MPKFKKPIVTIGEYLVATPDGKRKKVSFTADDLMMTANESNRLIENGNLIPAPFDHSIADGEGKEFFPTPVLGESDGHRLLKDSAVHNGGFWDQFEFADGTLYGIVDAPGDENDINTPAGKIGKTVTQTSMFRLPEYTDGKGETYKNALAHVALVNKAIEPGQGNFEPVEDEALAMGLIVSQSDFVHGIQMTSTMTPTPDKKTQMPSEQGENLDPVSQAVESLREAECLDLPEDTTAENFAERIIIACRQKMLDKSTEDDALGSVNAPPEGSKQRPTPIAMTNITDPSENGKPMTEQEQKAFDEQKAQNAILMSQVTETKKTDLKARVEALVSKGHLGRDVADKEYNPEVDAIVMSMVAGENGYVFSKPAIEIKLEALEQVFNKQAAPTDNIIDGDGIQMSIPAGYQVQDDLPGHDPSAKPLAKEELDRLAGHAHS